MSTQAGYVLGVGGVRPAVRAAPVLVTLALLAVPLAGCITPSSTPASEGVVVTGQPVLDAFERMNRTDALAGIPDWAATETPTNATRIGRPFTIDAESVIRLDPGLVLDHPHPLVSGPSRDALRTGVEPAGITYRELPTEPRLSTVRTVLDAVEAATGEPADPVWRALQRDLGAVNRTLEGVEPLDALVLFPAGLTAGAGTDADVLMELAHLDNVAAEAGLTGYRQITDEAIQRHGVERVVATSTMRDTPEEIAARPMFEGTPIEGHPERVLVVDPSRTTRLGPYLAQAVEQLATWAHAELPGPRVHVSTQPMKTTACGTIDVTVDAPNATVAWLGQTHPPGGITVPDVPDGHYILEVGGRDATGTATVTQLVTVEGSDCA